MDTAAASVPRAADAGVDSTGVDAVEVVGQAITRVVRMSNCVLAQTGRFGAPPGWEKATYLVLFHLEGGPRRSGAVAEALFLDPSTISRQVATLVKAGLVERSADPEDGRASLLTITEQGRSVLELHRAVRRDLLDRMITDWPSGDRHELARLLTRLADTLETRLPAYVESVIQARHEGES
ncbi:MULTISPECIES: MarR family winged helix-turn-helix transcriptional regulator [Actinoalloteichus]|uniref:Transcriptional regulator n=1 Tax=Actinoalloteichus fjordicus TaxID=1612552 RepID=A0AAC9L749_9PSEU|nr:MULTISPECIES: MarR family winged helix-turn-helix transcriptional regulator [Actinoalloteichus]APU12387.1 transcriptional regulator [Actinoalloteichus fjordicus]APU18339.1 transcriptional regulator [Actinoalloteichus sp. GBA129-24]